MALFKIFKGNDKSNLDAKPLTDGYAYYNTDTRRFYIDAYYPPTTEQEDKIKNYTGSKTGIVNYNGLIIDYTNSDNPLILDRRPINDDAIVSVSVGYKENTETNEKTLGYKFTHINGDKGFVPAAFPTMDGVNGITIEKTIPENDNELENLTIGLNLSEAINELEKSDENLSRSDYIIAEDGNELSGNIVTFEADEELPLKKLVVDIEPVQDLHGYDHPWPAGGGKNLLDRNAYTTNVALDDDGNVTSAGSTSSVSAHIPVIAGAQYTFSCICNSTGYKRVAAYAQDGTFIAPLLAKITGITSGEFRTETFTIPANAAYLIVGNNTSDTNIQLELGSYATAYEPYSNICPISGWTGCNIACNGDNLINPVLFLPGNFDASGNVVNTTSVNSKHTEKLPIKGGITYTLVSTSLITTNSFYCFYDKDKRFISSSLYLAYAEKSTFTAPENACFIACSIRHASDLPFGMSMYLGRTDKNKPYSGTVYPITFPEAGTVYGGALDVVSGVLTSTHRYLLLDDTLTYVVKNNERFDINLDEANIARTEDNSILLKNAYCSFLQVGNGHLTGNSSGITSVLAFLNISEWYSGEVSNAALRSYFNDMINAEKPCAVCYELATPITYQLTPQQITTLLGTNNIWADAGDIEVTYSNNTSIYKRKKLDSIFSILNKDDIIKALNICKKEYKDRVILVVGSFYVYKDIINNL